MMTVRALAFAPATRMMFTSCTSPDRTGVKDNPIRPLSRILAVDAQIGAWHERMQRESLLTTAVRRYLPRALAERVRVAEAATTTLTLAVPAGAVAAVVRQR